MNYSLGQILLLIIIIYNYYQKKNLKFINITLI